jgi:competence/damage-inducible protein CinA-like protein
LTPNAEFRIRLSDFDIGRWAWDVRRLLMRIALLNTGTELMLGDVQDTHLAFIAREIFPLGLRIGERRTVPDGPVIRDALAELSARCEILFVTGGLGPTTDDHTREIAAGFLDLKLVRNEAVLAAISERFAKRGFKLTERIERQAYVPEGAQALPNTGGTAPGLYFQANINSQISSPHIFLLPGPPRELQPMFRESVMPILQSIFATVPLLSRRFYKITGVGESTVEARVGSQILAIPGIELGYCARPGEVDVRILGDTAAVNRADSIVKRELGEAIFSTSDQALEEVVIELLTKRNETIAVAESCTGGLLAHRLTNVPGASAVFPAGYVVYANQAKAGALGVDRKSIEEHGAVSDPVARAMAEGARAHAGSTYALSTTGIAGPTGGSPEKPVGTVYIGLATSDQTTVKKFFFPADRETFKQMATQAALDLLRRRLIDHRNSKFQAPNPRETSNFNLQ